jgi:hypothetical protein
MTAIESILKKGSVYTRFRIGVHVMQDVLAAAPDPVAMDELERSSGCSSWVLARICAGLEQTGMLSRAAGIESAWLPGPRAGNVTLADILCSEIAHRGGRRRTTRGRGAYSDRRPATDVFVMQATISINQTVLAQLRRFPLRRAGSHAAALDA